MDTFSAVSVINNILDLIKTDYPEFSEEHDVSSFEPPELSPSMLVKSALLRVFNRDAHAFLRPWGQNVVGKFEEIHDAFVAEYGQDALDSIVKRIGKVETYGSKVVTKLQAAGVEFKDAGKVSGLLKNTQGAIKSAVEARMALQAR